MYWTIYFQEQNNCLRLTIQCAHPLIRAGDMLSVKATMMLGMMQIWSNKMTLAFFLLVRLSPLLLICKKSVFRSKTYLFYSMWLACCITIRCLKRKKITDEGCHWSWLIFVWNLQINCVYCINKSTIGRQSIRFCFEGDTVWFPKEIQQLQYHIKGQEDCFKHRITVWN